MSLKATLTLGKAQVCEQVHDKSKLHPSVATHPPWNQEYNQSYP